MSASKVESSFSRGTNLVNAANFAEIISGPEI